MRACCEREINTFMKKAVVLLSGGLDSIIAVKLMIEQGVEVVALHFTTPFCQCNNHKKGCGSSAQKIAEEFKVEIKTINNAEEFFKILKRPKHGFGSHMNPCIDCRILMLKTTKEYMEKIGASFVVTGEVLGQRPMSQHSEALDLIERKSGLKGLILRPLSAKWFEETIPEKEGWVDRNKLLSIKGRGRREQMNLADSYGIKDYPCPAGGCLLTDVHFSTRLKDLMKHSELSINEALLLKAGRHFRLDEKTKLIVGRNDNDNQVITSLSKEGDMIIDMSDCPGPVGLLRGNLSDENIDLACRITGRYADPVRNLEVPGLTNIIEDNVGKQQISNGADPSKDKSGLVAAELKISGNNKKVSVKPMTDEETRPYII